MADSPPPAPRVPPALAAYAARLLAGTGLSPADAARAAADGPDERMPAAAAAAAAALHDGWSGAAAAAGPEMGDGGPRGDR